MKATLPIGSALAFLLSSPALADSRCDCSSKIGKCDARVKLEGNRLLVSSSVPQCSMVVFFADGQPKVSSVTDGISSEEWLGPTASPKLEVDSCTVCADRNYPAAQTPAAPEGPSPFVGTWVVAGGCSWGRIRHTFSISDVTGGRVSAKGDFGNCSFDDGRVSGTSITMNCSNWLNSVRYVGSLVTPTQIRGTYTQTTSSERCSWEAHKE